MSVDNFHSGVVSPTGKWWVPADKKEKLWVTIAFVWCLVLFAMMPLWHLKGGQNPTGVRGKVSPADFEARTDRFIEEHGLRDAGGAIVEDEGIPVAAPPPGAHVYLEARQWQWRPVLHLKKGATYTIHLSSLDVNHGFGLYPVNLNFQVVPGYDYALKMTPDKAGDFRIVCNEFCGIAHHVMVGRVIVND
jgi:cytochrome c oxidase subunit 2